MSSLKAIGETVWGLLVDDGSLAIGIVVALGVTWIAATALGDAGRDLVGWLLVAMLVVLVVANLRAAGGSVRRRIS
ncbi:MAG TPA: hypothetical protein VKR80_04710 [Candidatus Limnocylindria bacterium]|nr:hypothetical protein [Candidatus Limnocylindria bacterium]